jgi:hypothetical protein
MSDRTKIARIAASIEAQQTHAKLARAGALKLTAAHAAVNQRLPATPRRRVPSMPRVTLDMKPTPERIAKEPAGFEQANGTKAYRIKAPIDAVSERLTEDETLTARRFVTDYLRAEAGRRQKVTACYDGVPAAQHGPRHGGVIDHARPAFTVMAIAASMMDRRFWYVLEKLAVGVQRERDGRPWTLEEIGREFMPTPYVDAASNRGVAVGLLKSALWRMSEFYGARSRLTQERA